MISLDPPVRLDEKPPEYATVVDTPPPSYDDAIKLDPQRLMMIADCGHRTEVDTCTVTIPDECDKSNGGGGAVVVAADATTTAHTVAATQQPSTTLAQAIRKSIRDIRKQLTNTVSDVADVEQYQQQQQQQQQSGSEHNATVVIANAHKSNAQTSNVTTN